MTEPKCSPALGARVRELREQKKRTDPRFTVRQFAKALGVSPAFISQFENGGAFVPKNEVVEMMAELLEVDKDELFALAQKVEPGVTGIIVERPAWADFLRTAKSSGWTAEDAKRIIEDYYRQQDEE